MFTDPRTSRALYRVPEAMALLSLSRSAIYEQIRSNACGRSSRAAVD